MNLDSMNPNGLTYVRWLIAALGGDTRTSTALKLGALEAWQRGECPADWRAAYDQCPECRDAKLRTAAVCAVCDAAK